MPRRIDDHKKFYEQFWKCLNLGNHDDSTIRVKIAELLRLNPSESEDEQLNLKEYVDLMKVQMRNDLIKDFADPLNKRIDDLTAQHHGLSQRVAQLKSRQHVIVDDPVAVRIAERLCGLRSPRSNALFPAR